MAAINITKKAVDILVNGSLQQSYDQQANSANYDLDISSSCNASANTVTAVTVYASDDNGTAEETDYSIIDDNGSTIGSGTLYIGGFGPGDASLHVYENIATPVSISWSGFDAEERGKYQGSRTPNTSSSSSFTVNGVNQS